MTDSRTIPVNNHRTLWIDGGGEHPVVALSRPGQPIVCDTSRHAPLEGLAPLLARFLSNHGISTLDAVDFLCIGSDSGSVLGIRSAIATANTFAILHPHLQVLGFDRIRLTAAILRDQGISPPFRIVTPRGRARVVSGGFDSHESRIAPVPGPADDPSLRQEDIQVFALGSPARFRPTPPPHWNPIPSVPFANLDPSSPRVLACLDPIRELPTLPRDAFQPWIGERHR